MDTDELIAARYHALEGILDERQRRLHAAVEAKVLGHGGVKRVSLATGVARGSILAGIKELESPLQTLKDGARRVRRPGAGRKKPRSWWSRIQACERHLSGWWNPPQEATRSHRCDGPARV